MESMDERVDEDEDEVKLVEHESRRDRPRVRDRREVVRARRAEGLWFSERRSSPKGSRDVFDSIASRCPPTDLRTQSQSTMGRGVMDERENDGQRWDGQVKSNPPPIFDLF